MRDLYSGNDTTLGGYYQSVLESAGVPCFVRNFYDGYSSISSVSTPTLCVTHDEDYDRAVEILRQTRPAEPANRPDWTCPECGEEVPGTFDSCWKCGAERPA